MEPLYQLDEVSLDYNEEMASYPSRRGVAKLPSE